VFFLAQSLAYLLYLFPRSEWLWFLSVPLNREARPILELFDAALPLAPLASCAILAGVCVVPLVFFLKRSWLGISVFGHIALFVAFIPVNIAVQSAGRSVSYASLADAAELVARNTITSFWLLAVAVLLPLCLLNHVAFFRGVRQRASGLSG
jgi:hypothetical protein